MSLSSFATCRPQLTSTSHDYSSHHLVIILLTCTPRGGHIIISSITNFRLNILHLQLALYPIQFSRHLPRLSPPLRLTNSDGIRNANSTVTIGLLSNDSRLTALTSSFISRGISNSIAKYCNTLIFCNIYCNTFEVLY